MCSKLISMKTRYILLWLEAPLQSWGFDSKFGRRDTAQFPTKSGVLGLLCCARGAGGKQLEWLKRWAGLDMRVIAYAPGDSSTTNEKPALLCDFHMIGSGYNASDRWENLNIPKTRDGKPAVGGGTKITYRYYVQDMAYAVLVEAPTEEIDEITEALQSPVWDLYLGRKACAPTDFIFRGIFDDAEEGTLAALKIGESKSRTRIFTVLQGAHEGEVFSMNDVPVCFGPFKRYRDRQVTVQTSVL